MLWKWRWITVVPLRPPDFWVSVSRRLNRFLVKETVRCPVLDYQVGSLCLRKQLGTTVASWLHVLPHVGTIQDLENDQTLFITSFPLSDALNPRFIQDSCLLSLSGWKSLFSWKHVHLILKNTRAVSKWPAFALTFGIKSGSVHMQQKIPKAHTHS